MWQLLGGLPPRQRAVLVLRYYGHKRQVVSGAAAVATDQSLVSPDSRTLDQLLLDRPGNDAVQLKLFREYPTNIDLYPAVQEYFRTSSTPLPGTFAAFSAGC
jgi:hypothetical protein